MSPDCIADALNQVFPDRKFSITINGIRDFKFPIYVTYTLRLKEITPEGSFDSYVVSSRVHRRESDKKEEISKLVVKLLVELFTRFGSKVADIPLQELKF